jgi:2-iminoacetate synthase ThiH
MYMIDNHAYCTQYCYFFCPICLFMQERGGGESEGVRELEVQVVREREFESEIGRERGEE